MKKNNKGFFEKLFGMGFSAGSNRMPLRSNIYTGSGYSRIGGTGRFGKDRESALLGTASPSNRITGYYERHDELKSYQLIDICKLSTSFFSDYCLSFLDDSSQAVSILDKDTGSVDESKTERVNDVLVNELKIYDYIRNHINDYIYNGQYGSLLCHSKDELGHTSFRFEELYDPTSIIVQKERGKDGIIKETSLVRGEDNKIYEIGEGDFYILGTPSLRLINDIGEGLSNGSSGPFKEIPTPTFGKKEDCFSKVVRTKSYSVGEPLFYSMVLKVKELIVKELLISLISMRDISSVQIFLLQFDKSTPLETANDLCARTTKLANNTNDLASFMTSQFDVVSFIENTLSQSAKFVPDYNATMGNKNVMLPLDKLSDKLIELQQNLDSCKMGILSPLGIPSSILDSASGSKWAILQQSERANSRVTLYMDGIKNSVVRLVQNIYKCMYQEDLDKDLIKLHISEKTTVEYNNQINQSESIGNLMQGISTIITNALQTLDVGAPLIDTKAYLSYIQNLIKDIDPNTEPIITEDTIEKYSVYSINKLKASAEQQGIDPSIFDDTQNDGGPMQ